MLFSKFGIYSYIKSTNKFAKFLYLILYLEIESKMIMPKQVSKKISKTIARCIIGFK